MLKVTKVSSLRTGFFSIFNLMTPKKVRGAFGLLKDWYWYSYLVNSYVLQSNNCT